MGIVERHEGPRWRSRGDYAADWGHERSAGRHQRHDEEFERSIYSYRGHLIWGEIAITRLVFEIGVEIARIVDY